MPGMIGKSIGRRIGNIGNGGSIAAVICHCLVLCQFLLMEKDLDNFILFSWHFYTFLSISAGISLYLVFWGISNGIYSLLLVKLSLIYLIGYPFGDYIWIEQTLLFSLILESGLWIPLPYNAAFLSAAISLTVLFQNARSAFHTRLSIASFHDILLLAFYSVLTAVLIILIRYFFDRYSLQKEKTARLNLAAVRLTDANIGFQSYASGIEVESIINERKRISREIHDSVGYSLTNITMLLEASSLLIETDKEKVGALIIKSREEVQNCLEETRQSMRQLRKKSIKRISGIQAFQKLISSFQDATGVNVDVSYANLPEPPDERIGKALFRLIQESMTNSFRHGMATEIRINFWFTGRNLRVSIKDNGSSISDYTEGIGLKGMRERIREVGGFLKMRNRVDGFEVTADIPFNRISLNEKDKSFTG